MRCPSCNADVKGNFCCYCGVKLPEEEKRASSKQNINVNNQRKYVFPPISILTKGVYELTENTLYELKETALRLQQTLQTFGVSVTITDISQGPSVTRFELQPQIFVLKRLFRERRQSVSKCLIRKI